MSMLHKFSAVTVLFLYLAGCGGSGGGSSGTDSSVPTIGTIANAWGLAELIETDNDAPLVALNVPQSRPQVAMDDTDNGIAVWYQSDGTRNNIWSNRYVMGVGWGTAELIETDNTGTAILPQVALDNSGNGAAVWSQSDGTRLNIWSNRYTIGTGWGLAQLIETNNAGNATTPQVKFDGAGNAISVWVQNDGIRDNIWANRYTAGVGWGTAELIETDNTGNARGPEIVINSAGQAYAVWSQFSGGTAFNIWTNQYTMGSGWSTAQLISAIGNAGSPQAAIDDAGNAAAIWSQIDGSSINIWTISYDTTSGWGAPVNLGGTNPGNPQIAFLGTGNRIAVWDDVSAGVRSIKAIKYDSGSGWSATEEIETNAGDARLAQIAASSSGNVLTVWEQSDGTVYNIWSNRYD